MRLISRTVGTIITEDKKREGVRARARNRTYTRANHTYTRSCMWALDKGKKRERKDEPDAPSLSAETLIRKSE